MKPITELVLQVFNGFVTLTLTNSLSPISFDLQSYNKKLLCHVIRAHAEQMLSARSAMVRDHALVRRNISAIHTLGVALSV